MSPKLGAKRDVWHVIGPGVKNGRPGQWCCLDSEKAAQLVAAGMKRSQTTRGVAILSAHEGLRFWDVRRPEWRDEDAQAA